MGTKVKIVLYLTGLLFLHACDYVDIPDMFISPSSVNKRFDQSMSWNASNPAQEITVSSEDYSILNVADIHVGSTKNLSTFLQIAKLKNPAAVLVNGDFCSGHSADYETFENTLLPQDSLKSFLSVGNHELYFDGWKEYNNRFGSSIYYFSIKTPTQQDLYICLDSGSGTLGENQLAWLRTLLSQKRSAYRYCIVYTHVNLFRIRHTSSTNPNMEELYELLDIFAKYRVDMVLTGHDHIRYVEKIGTTTHLSVDAIKDGVENASYLQIDIQSNALTYNFIKL